MLNINKNGKNAQGAEVPTHEKTGLFFPQYIPVPGPLSGQVQLMLVPGSGIPMRDYFAAHALMTVAPYEYGGNNSRETAEWAYRVADAMIAARATVETKDVPEYTSQFHEDYMRKVASGLWKIK